MYANTKHLIFRTMLCTNKTKLYDMRYSVLIKRLEHINANEIHEHD